MVQDISEDFVAVISSGKTIASLTQTPKLLVQHQAIVSICKAISKEPIISAGDLNPPKFG